MTRKSLGPVEYVSPCVTTPVQKAFDMECHQAWHQMPQGLPWGARRQDEGKKAPLTPAWVMLTIIATPDNR